MKYAPRLNQPRSQLLRLSAAIVVALLFAQVAISVQAVAAELLPTRTIHAVTQDTDPTAPREYATKLYLPTVTTEGIVEGAGALSYYVDCSGGNDANSGTSSTSAWRTIAKANAAPLVPGGRLLLKRGCTWSETLKAKWVGTSTSPIVISAYGSGALPRILNANPDGVTITGSYQIIEYLEVHTDPPAIDPNCANQPYGWRIGFAFNSSTAAYNTLRNSKASGLTAGVHLNVGSHHNKIINNTLVDNVLMSVNTNNHGNDDSGAWGILLNGDDNEIARNYLSGNNAWCSYDYGPGEGASIEVYKAKRNYIHNNRSLGDSTFSELGGSSTVKSQDNVFAYNLYSSPNRKSTFLIVFGPSNSFGPAYGTKAYNNTIYLGNVTGSQGIVCTSGCSSSLLSMKNNIIVGGTKAAFADAPFDESNNIFWKDDGKPFVQFMGFTMSPTDRKIDPQFVAPSANNFRLQSTSPAINAGTGVPLSWSPVVDLDQIPVPQNGGIDIGGFEYMP